MFLSRSSVKYSLDRDTVYLQALSTLGLQFTANKTYHQISGAANAKNAPTRYSSIDAYRIHVDNRRAFLHSRASVKSVGHNLGVHARIAKLMAIHAPATAKIKVLCSESHISCGNEPRSETKVAPAPSITKSAGRAQHNNVLSERRSVTLGKILLTCITHPEKAKTTNRLAPMLLAPSMNRAFARQQQPHTLHR